MEKKQGSSDGYRAKTGKVTAAAPIHYYTKSVYGNDMHYMYDPEMAKHVQTLTGQRTLSTRHTDALRALGHDVQHVPKN
jgi:hypothetical protein